jgi:hypothetical protein
MGEKNAPMSAQLSMQEARFICISLLQSHTSMKASKPEVVPISELRELLLFDSDKAVLAWLGQFNPIFCVTSAGVAAVLLKLDLSVDPGRRRNNRTVSQFLLEKAKGTCWLYRLSSCIMIWPCILGLL